MIMHAAVNGSAYAAHHFTFYSNINKEKIQFSHRLVYDEVNLVVCYLIDCQKLKLLKYLQNVLR